MGCCRFVLRAFLLVALAVAAAGPFSPAPGQEEAATAPPAVPAPAPAARPPLSELVLLSAQLDAARAADEEALRTAVDAAATQRTLDERAQRIDALALALERIRGSEGLGFDQLSEFKFNLEGETLLLERAVAPVTAALRGLESRRTRWLQEQAQWGGWQAALPAGAEYQAVRATLEQATASISGAVAALDTSLQPLVDLQRRAGELGARLQSLDTESDALLRRLRDEVFRRSGPSLLSPAFFRELRPKLWRDLGAGFAQTTWPDWEYLQGSGWVVVVQLFVIVALATAIHHRRDLLARSERWQFLCQRPLAVGLLAGLTVTSPLHGSMSPVLRLALQLTVGLALARLLTSLFRSRARGRLLYILVAVKFLGQTARVLGVPFPLYRLFLGGVALGGAVLCAGLARRTRLRGGPAWLLWGWRAAGLIFVFGFLAELGGYSALAMGVLKASSDTVLAVLLFWMLARLARGALEFLFGESFVLSRVPLVRMNAAVLIERAGLLVDAVLAVAAVAVVLNIWQVYGTAQEALDGLFGWGFEVGGSRFSLGLLLGAVLVMYGAFLTSWALQAVLMEELYPRRGVARGVRISINRLLHYALVLLGFLFALGVLGVELKNVTILAGALGVGIGFGLQTIVNNFVSGLILLFERPVKVGDVVQIGGEWGTISKLGLRATVVQTFDQAEIIVPNSELVSTAVTNWTLSNRRVRVVVPVGVAYGSDVARVMEILEAVATGHEKTVAYPKPQVLFLGFGDSSLDFELRCWIADVDDRLTVKSDLNREIDRRFREAGIEIPFPQRDLHLRSVDAAAGAALAAAPAADPQQPA